jgi:GAF domain-containing protein
VDGATSARLLAVGGQGRFLTDQPNKPALDEQTFEKLLEAAYVMQEHNRKLRVLEASLEAQSEQLREEELAKQALLKRVKPAAEERSKADADYTLTLAQIVESQHQIQMRHLGLDMAMSVVAERVARITGASGAGIGLLAGGTVRYRAGAGPPALPVGTEVPLLKAVCQANIRTGQVIRTPDVDTEFLFDPDPCKHRGIRSLVAVPIHYDGNIVGALELYFNGLQGFAEQDIHTCQLMAGLVTEAIGRDAESKSRRSVSDERSAIVGEIERPQPNRAAEARSVLAGKKTAETTTAKSPCWKCGNNLLSQEVFCGKCGAPRSNDGEASRSTLQGKLEAPAHPAETILPFGLHCTPPLTM